MTQATSSDEISIPETGESKPKEARAQEARPVGPNEKSVIGKIEHGGDPDQTLKAIAGQEDRIDALGGVDHFDQKSLRIDEEESKGFLHEGKAKVSRMKIARDGEGRKVLLKTSPFMVGQNEQLLTEGEFLQEATTFGFQENPQAMYESIVDGLRGEETAWKVGGLVDASMAETRFVKVGDTPFVAYRFIDGIRDVGFGGGEIGFAEDGSEALRTQELAVARGALLKFLAGGTGDNGQYLQDAEGNIYSSDIHFSPQPSGSEGRLLGEIASQSTSGDGYLMPQLDNLKHQLKGMGLPDFKKSLADLGAVGENEALQILFATQDSLSDQDRINARNFVDRAHKAERIFTLLADNPEEATKMVNPTKDGKPVFAKDEIDGARMQMYQKLNKKITELK